MSLLPLGRATTTLAVATMLTASPALAQDTEQRVDPAAAPVSAPADAIVPAGNSDEPIAMDADAQPLLWHVEGPTGQQAWLLGTVHVGIDWDTMAPTVLTALSDSDIVAIETDVRSINPFALLQMAEATDDLPGVGHYLSDEQFAALAAQLQDVLPEPTLRQLQPWFAMMMQMSVLLPSETTPLDMAVLEEGTEQGKDLRFFEAWDAQIGLIASMPVDYVVESISETLASPDAAEAELRAMVNAYVEGDTERLASLVTDAENVEEWPEFFEALLYTRNEAWVPTLESWMSDGTVFAAVGSGHLLGDRSVLSLLEARGYSVTRSSR